MDAIVILQAAAAHQVVVVCVVMVLLGLVGIRGYLAVRRQGEARRESAMIDLEIAAFQAQRRILAKAGRA